MVGCPRESQILLAVRSYISVSLILQGFQNSSLKPVARIQKVHIVILGAFLEGDLHFPAQNSFAYFASRTLSLFALKNGIPEEDIMTRNDQLKKADQEGRFGFNSAPVLTTAIAL